MLPSGCFTPYLTQIILLATMWLPLPEYRIALESIIVDLFVQFTIQTDSYPVI
jgi:hypothetical protein